MTTREPGASEVLTQGLVGRPRSTARLASSPAPTITWGLEVLVQLVMAAITTSPSVSWWSPIGWPTPPWTGADRSDRPSAAWKARAGAGQ